MHLLKGYTVFHSYDITLLRHQMQPLSSHSHVMVEAQIHVRVYHSKWYHAMLYHLVAMQLYCLVSLVKECTWHCGFSALQTNTPYLLCFCWCRCVYLLDCLLPGLHRYWIVFNESWWKDGECLVIMTNPSYSGSILWHNNLLQLFHNTRFDLNTERWFGAITGVTTWTHYTSTTYT